MITVKFSDNGFEVRGHSGYADAGTDIVCAAVSASAELTVNAITEILEKRVQLELDDAIPLIGIAVPKESMDICVDRFLQAFRLQINLIAEQYSEFITII